jgi:hypothetical protein
MALPSKFHRIRQAGYDGVPACDLMDHGVDSDGLRIIASPILLKTAEQVVEEPEKEPEVPQAAMAIDGNTCSGLTAGINQV